jgi:hypothetical protein
MIEVLLDFGAEDIHQGGFSQLLELVIHIFYKQGKISPQRMKLPTDVFHKSVGSFIRRK